LKLNSPRGTADIYGNDIKYRDCAVNTVRELFKVFGFKEIITPAFEYTEVFSRSIGQATDIVQKEMYTFTDKKGRSLTLRPEGTASVVRSVVENKMLSEAELPLKLFYIGNMFRYERPQKGRMREFWQIGVEALGSNEPMIDAELIWLLNEIFLKLGFKKLQLNINSIGCDKCRESFILKFKDYIKPDLGKLCSDCRRRYADNPLRIYDCKVEQCKKVISGGPGMSGYLCPECSKHLESLQAILKELSIKYTIDDGLVRGFDYYSGTVFEIISNDLESAQNALGGGGRYDSLLAEFGGPDMPAAGFAIGLDRTLLLMKELGIGPGKGNGGIRAYIIGTAPGDPYCIDVLKSLRDAGIACEVDYSNKNIGKGVKKAGKSGFDLAVIIGDDEKKNGTVSIKDLKEFKQASVKKEKVAEYIMDRAGAE